MTLNTPTAHQWTTKKRVTIFFLAIALGTMFLPGQARAGNFTLQGTIRTDDAVELFNVAIATGGSVDLRSYGYAGGTTSTGISAPSGGFETILTLFSLSGNLLNENDDGVGVAIDPSTGLAGDSRITTTLNPGSYILALTQYDNFARGSMAEGFTQTGNPNFTANPDFTTGEPCPGNLFRDISGAPGRCRNGNWTLDFGGVASVTPVAAVPEPSNSVLLLSIPLGFAWVARKRRIASPKLLDPASRTSL